MLFSRFRRGRSAGFSIVDSLTSLSAFLAGATLGGRLCMIMAAHTRRRWLLTAGVSEAALLFAAAVASIGIGMTTATKASAILVVIILTAVARGLRTAIVRRLALTDLSTTVLTTMLTGLAAADSYFAGGKILGSDGVWLPSS